MTGFGSQILTCPVNYGIKNFDENPLIATEANSPFSLKMDILYNDFDLTILFIM